MTERSALAPGEVVRYTGGEHDIKIRGGLGRGAQLIVTGGYNDVYIHGYLDADSEVKVTGGNNDVYYNGKHPTARVIMSGGYNDEHDRGGEPPKSDKFGPIVYDASGARLAVQKSPRPREEWGS